MMTDGDCKTMSDPYSAKGLYHGLVAEQYDQKRFKSIKGRWLDKREKLAVRNALQHVNADCTLLDLPCGTGRITDFLLSLGYRVAGGDVSSEMIALAKERIGHHDRLLGFHELDAEQMSLADNSYDCITSVRLMGHLPAPVRLKVLREMARVAREYLVISFYTRGVVPSVKWLVQHGKPMRRSAWYPVNRPELDEMFRVCGVERVAQYRVFPVLSDAITCVLRVRSS